MAKLLLVDDSELVLDMLSMALAGHDFVKASDAAEALDHVSRETFDAIITDLNLPDQDGDELIGALHEAGVEAPIFLMSGIPAAELEARASELGAAGSLSKDLGLPGMAARLNDLLEGF